MNIGCTYVILDTRGTYPGTKNVNGSFTFLADFWYYMLTATIPR